jgi:ankyrin repeat protein
MTIPQMRSPDEQRDLDNRLIDAAQRGHTETVQVLIADGADVCVQNDMALRWAASGGHTETVKILLAAGTDVHAQDDDVHAQDDHALRLAGWHGHTETVKALLASGANVHAGNDAALRGAAHNGHTETVRALARHIFAPDFWCGKSRAEIEARADALYNKIKTDYPLDPIKPERLRTAATILVDYALRCWHQVRPAPPKPQISPHAAQPRPL